MLQVSEGTFSVEGDTLSCQSEDAPQSNTFRFETSQNEAILGQLRLEIDENSVVRSQRDQYLYANIYAEIDGVTNLQQIVRDNIEVNTVLVLKTQFGEFSEHQEMVEYDYNSDPDKVIMEVGLTHDDTFYQNATGLQLCIQNL